MRRQATPPPSPAKLAGLAAGWVGLVAAGMGVIARHQMTPGEVPAADSRPLGSGSPSARTGSDGPTLVVFLHPRCPCGAATVGELARLMARCGGRLAARVVVSGSAGAAPGVTPAGPWRDAGTIPGVTVVPDPGGDAARRSGVRTSGQAILYDPAGRVRFAGGITAARGHAGDNAGADTVADLVLRPPGGSPGGVAGEVAVRRTPVYGCALEASGG